MGSLSKQVARGFSVALQLGRRHSYPGYRGAKTLNLNRGKKINIELKIEHKMRILKKMNARHCEIYHSANECSCKEKMVGPFPLLSFGLQLPDNKKTR